MRYCSGAGIVRSQGLEQVEELLAGVGVVLDPVEEVVEQRGDIGTGHVVPSGQACLGQEPAGLGGLGDPAEQRDRLLGVAPGDQQPRQRRNGDGVVGLELQGPPQGLLGTGVGSGLRQEVRLGTGAVSAPATKARTSASGLGPDELVDDGAVLHGEHRGDRLDLETAGHGRVLVHVDLGQLDGAVGVCHRLLQERAEGRTGPAPGRPQVHHHGDLEGALEHRLLERGISDVDHAPDDTGRHHPAGPEAGWARRRG